MRLAFLFLGLMFTIPAFANANCPYDIGNALSYDKTSLTFENLYKNQLAKDEFETVSAFEERVNKSTLFKQGYLFEGELNDFFSKTDLYVACTRARTYLHVITHDSATAKVVEEAIEHGWDTAERADA